MNDVDKNSNTFFTLETIFLLCDFHREQSWDRWLKKGKNGMNEKYVEGTTKREVVLELLRPIAKSMTEEEMKKRMDVLKCSQVWKESAKLQAWLNDTWFSCCKVIFFEKMKSLRII